MSARYDRAMLIPLLMSIGLIASLAMLLSALSGASRRRHARSGADGSVAYMGGGTDCDSGDAGCSDGGGGDGGGGGGGD